MGRGRVIRSVLGFLLLSTLLNGQVLPADSLLGQSQLPMMRRLAIVPNLQEFDPVTGEPLPQKAQPKIDPDTGLPLAPVGEEPPQLPFDPVTGERVPAEPAPMSGPLVVAGTWPVLTAQQVTSLARTEAQRRHSGGAWAAGGGLLGCGGMILGGILGGNLLGFPGFLIGAGVGAVGTSEMLAASFIEVPLPVELEAATPELQETYRQAYVSRTRALRRTSIYSAF